MNQHIHCSINNCHYWNQGNKCEANEIIVMADTQGHSYPDKIDATQSNSISPMSVSSCMETCCKTFVPQNSNKTNIDGIKRM